jgi:5-methylcytosine-specific restriction endonuclease McrA
MPTQPKPKKKPWTPDRVQHQRVKDMRWFYNSRTWRSFSKNYKVRNPICKSCEASGMYVPTKVTDHLKTYELEPLGFDLTALRDEYMQPLCKSCHDSKSGKEGHR